MVCSYTAGYSPLLEGVGHHQGANEVAVDAVGAPFGGGHTGHAPDALLGCGVGGLAGLAEQARAGGEVDHGALRLLQVGVAVLHIEEGGVQAGVDGLVKLLLGVLGQGDAGGRVLGVVDQKVDAAQGVRRLLHQGRHLLLHAAIGLAGQHLHAVEPLQLLLGVVQLLGVPAGDDQIAALLGEGGGQAVADAAALAAAGDNRYSAVKLTHIVSSLNFLVLF